MIKAKQLPMVWLDNHAIVIKILKTKTKILFYGGKYYGTVRIRLNLVAIYGDMYGKLIEMLEMPKACILKRKSE